jgi:hypothetical protein
MHVCKQLTLLSNNQRTLLLLCLNHAFAMHTASADPHVSPQDPVLGTMDLNMLQDRHYHTCNLSGRRQHLLDAGLPAAGHATIATAVLPAMSTAAVTATIQTPNQCSTGSCWSGE